MNTVTHDIEDAPAPPKSEPEKREGYDIPLSVIDWLDEEALRRKRATGSGRAAKGPVVVEAIRRYRQWLEAERAAGRTGYEEPAADEKGGAE